ncbi:glycerol-3-phosphate acyltransferase 2 [Clostridia bacterium]|nr:glycerol-3-phosphate acyltransferase 2 [Clostridia bacterium]
MNSAMAFVISVLLAYILGSICTGTIVSRHVMRRDIRELGSGNPGFANSLRVMGKRWAAVVFAVDFLKGFAAMLAAKWLLADVSPEFAYLYLFAAIFVLLGHAYPLFFNFKGGKGISTTAGVVAVLDWRVMLIAIGVYLLIVLTTRVSSLGSIVAACSVPVLMAIFRREYAFIVATGVIALLIVFWHRGNIERLIKGNEKKI